MWDATSRGDLQPMRGAKLPNGWWCSRSALGWKPRAIAARRLRRLQKRRAQMRSTTVTCLFFSNDGRMSVKLLDAPVPAEYTEAAAPDGMFHACRVLGIQPIRYFKRTAEGSIPVFEEP